MVKKRETYIKLLKENRLDSRPIVNIIAALKEHLVIEPIPENILSGEKYDTKISGELSKLPLYWVKGKNSWNGLVVSFPGDNKQITTEMITTPYLRKILYQILELRRRLNVHYKNTFPCIYIIGSRFPDVLLRKFYLLKSITPHVIIISSDLIQCTKKILQIIGNKVNEHYVQSVLSHKMSSKDGLTIPTRTGEITVGFLCTELPTREGTINPERLDILAYGKTSHALVAFEMKGPNSSRIEIENLFLQGMEHRNWLEENKMAIKFVFDGPTGSKINTRKRVILILGLMTNKIPALFYQLREKAEKSDRFLQIEFIHIKVSVDNNTKLTLLE